MTGVGNEKEGHVYRGVSYSTSDIQRRFLSIVVSDPFLDRTVEAILTAVFTGITGVSNFGLSASKAIKITDAFSLGVAAAAIFNPDTDDAYLVFVISL